LKDAHFRLQTSNKYIFYEIVLGAASNTRSDIRSPTGAHLNYTFTTNLLRLDEYLPFVIAWNNSKIVVAREHNGSDIILEWSAPAANINVEMVGLAGYRLGFEATGDSHFEQYQLQETEGKMISSRSIACTNCYFMHTHDQHTYKTHIIYTKIKKNMEITYTFKALYKFSYL